MPMTRGHRNLAARKVGWVLPTPWSHLFQGLKLTDVTGLAYVRHRDYSPTLGRFIERDPVGFEAGDGNWYRFVGNSPAQNSDPLGLAEWIEGGTWELKNMRFHLHSWWGETLAENYPGQKDNPNWRVLVAGLNAKYTVTGTAALKGRIDCGCGHVVDVDASLDMSFDIRQRVATRVSMIFDLARLALFRNWFASVNRLIFVKSAIEKTITLSNVISWIDKVASATKDLDKLYKIVDGKTVSIATSPGIVCDLGVDAIKIGARLHGAIDLTSGGRPLGRPMDAWWHTPGSKWGDGITEVDHLFTLPDLRSGGR